jgi:hypothetical protein
MLSNMIQRQDNDGLNINVTGGAPINLAVEDFDPNLLNPAGAVDPLTGQAAVGRGGKLRGWGSRVREESCCLAAGQPDILFDTLPEPRSAIE